MASEAQLGRTPVVPAACDRLYCLTLGHEYIPRELAIEGGSDEVLRLPLTSLLVHSPDGWFLFDTGLSEEIARDPEKFGLWYLWGAPELPGPGDPLLEALAACGVRASELAGVVMSHFHVDHTGGLRHFVAGPPVFVQRAELEFGLSDEAKAAPCWQPDFADERIRWELLDGDGPIAAGIEALFTPGHAPGHMSYRIDMAESGRWLFAFDAIPLAENVELDRPINVGSRPEDAPQRRVAHDRLVALSRSEEARLVPGHCPVTWPSLEAPPGHYR